MTWLLWQELFACLYGVGGLPNSTQTLPRRRRVGSMLRRSAHPAHRSAPPAPRAGSSTAPSQATTPTYRCALSKVPTNAACTAVPADHSTPALNASQCGSQARQGLVLHMYFALSTCIVMGIPRASHRQACRQAAAGVAWQTRTDPRRQKGDFPLPRRGVYTARPKSGGFGYNQTTLSQLIKGYKGVVRGFPGVF